MSRRHRPSQQQPQLLPPVHNSLSPSLSRGLSNECCELKRTQTPCAESELASHGPVLTAHPVASCLRSGAKTLASSRARSLAGRRHAVAAKTAAKQLPRAELPQGMGLSNRAGEEPEMEKELAAMLC